MDGVFPFLKPPGITSHDAISICRRLLKEKRIGHSGTLDPLAMGVLPIFVGRATRLIEYTSNHSKTYVAECRLHIETNTGDQTGEVTTSLYDLGLPLPEVNWEKLTRSLQGFKGRQLQRPPTFSAIKINGKKAYELARAGKAVDLPSREIEIYHIEPLALGKELFTIRVTCSSGTYIRTLLEDICKDLGTLGHMTQLVRSQVGEFHISQAICTEELETLGENVLLPTDLVVSHMPRVDVTEGQRVALIQGKEIPLANLALTGDAPLWRVYENQNFLGISKKTTSSLKVEKNIFI